jgi:hypothetical protein
MNSLTILKGKHESTEVLAKNSANAARIAFGGGVSLLLAMVHKDQSAIPGLTSWLLNGVWLNCLFFGTTALTGLTFASSGREWRNGGWLCRTLGKLLAPAYATSAGLAAGWIGAFLAMGVLEDHRRLYVALSIACLTLITLAGPTVVLLSARHLVDKVSARPFAHKWRLQVVRAAGFVLTAVSCWGFVETVVLLPR